MLVTLLAAVAAASPFPQGSQADRPVGLTVGDVHVGKGGGGVVRAGGG